MARVESDPAREEAWQAAKQAVHAYSVEPTTRNAAAVASAWRHVRRMAAGASVHYAE